MQTLVVFFTALRLVQGPFMALPDGNTTWAITVVTRGGIFGVGSGGFSMSSEGRIACSSETACSKTFNTSEFQPLIEAIRSIKQPALAPPVVSLCSDCITRTLLISQRDSAGVTHFFIASWNDITKDRLPKEAIRIYDAALKILSRD